MAGRSVHNARIERLWRDVYSKVLDKYYRLFYHLEDHGILDIDNELHIFCLHYCFLPRISHDLDLFRNAYNHHSIRTEHNRTPLQLWTSGILEQVNINSTAIRNIFSPPQPDLTQHDRHDLSEDNLPDLNEDNLPDLQETQSELPAFQQFTITNHIIIPSVANPLSRHNFTILQDTVDPLSSSEHQGIDIYGRVLTYCLQHIASELDSEPN